jgi:cytochrome P450
MPDPIDPFRAARIETGSQSVHCDGEDVTLVLRLQDARRAANDWQTFSSDHPFMVVLHPETDVRSVRQLPIETDPPDHTDYRRLVEPIFRRPLQSDYQAVIAALVEEAVAAALATGTVEVVRDLALPLQSRALTRLLGMPAAETDI